MPTTLRRAVRRCTLTTLALILGACGNAPAVDEPKPMDPLGLATCPGPAGDLAHAVPIPAPRFAPPEAEAHETACALRTLTQAMPPRAVVCVGEDAHGVHEASAFQLAAVRSLVLAGGARTVALEEMDAELAEVRGFLVDGDPARLDRYCATLLGTIASTVEHQRIMEGLREVALLLPPGETLAVRGIDVAVQVNGTRQRLLDFYARVAPDRLAAHTAGLPKELAARSPAVCEQAAAYAGTILDELAANQAAYVAASTQAAWQTAQEDALDLRDGYAFLAYYVQGDFDTGDALHREPGMARNLTRLAAGPAPIVVLAHNAHCGKGTGIGDAPSLGARIAASELAARYRVVASAYVSGEQLVSGSTGLERWPVPLGDFGPTLGAVASADAFLLSATSADFDGARTYEGEYRNEYAPAEDFDVLTLIRNVTASTERPR